MFFSRLSAIPLWSISLIGAQAFVKSCIYQADKCGFTLISTYGKSIRLDLTYLSQELT
jgi:hypothetical protein